MSMSRILVWDAGIDEYPHMDWVQILSSQTAKWDTDKHGFKKMVISLREKAFHTLEISGRGIMKGKNEHRGGAPRGGRNRTLLN